MRHDERWLVVSQFFGGEEDFVNFVKGAGENDTQALLLDSVIK